MKLRLRFSVRTLVILVTLVCAYLGAWEATKRYGVPRGDRMLLEEFEFVDASSPFPFVVRGREEFIILNAARPFRTKDHYYIWLFGAKMKVPFESDY